ncbi:MAG: hypothetical protein KHZ73_08950 [Lachnospiraceae bacterium]|nr:hypothetical protein [Lachnospiraceae bacterium]
MSDRVKGGRNRLRAGDVRERRGAGFWLSRAIGWGGGVPEACAWVYQIRNNGWIHAGK